MTMTVKTINIGARPSALAQTQARGVEEALFSTIGCKTNVVAVLTQGDHVGPKADIQSVPLAVSSSDFTSALDAALLSNEIDAAVHSLKDVPPTTRWRTNNDCQIVCYLPREVPHDVLVVGSPLLIDRTSSIDELPPHAKVGTSSARRQAQLLAKRPDLELVNVRGNVETRLEALADGRVDALILAQAGLDRLLQNESDHDDSNNNNNNNKAKLLLEQLAWHTIPSADMLSAPCQGIVAVVCRMYDKDTAELIKTITDRDATLAAVAERAFLNVLDSFSPTSYVYDPLQQQEQNGPSSASPGSSPPAVSAAAASSPLPSKKMAKTPWLGRPPLAAFLEKISDTEWIFHGLLARPDGTKVLRESVPVTFSTVSKEMLHVCEIEAEKVGQECAKDLLQQAGTSFYDDPS